MRLSGAWSSSDGSNPVVDAGKSGMMWPAAIKARTHITLIE